MLNFYQNLPNYINPVFFSVGFFQVYWYSVMWILTLITIYFLLLWRLKKGEKSYKKIFIEDLLLNGFIGALIGGRLGYVIFYNLNYFIAHPIEIFSPYNFVTENWTGIYGMSFHGGAIGVVIALILTAKKNQENCLEVFDFVMPVFPLGYFFGRLGNFFNSELVGRITKKNWGMYFNDEIFLRHPSQLYEAFGEGLFIFLILWFLRNKKLPKGVLSSFFLIFYSGIRFFIEFYREPDSHLGFLFLNLSMGQILSLIMFFIGIFLIFFLGKRPNFYKNT